MITNRLTEITQGRSDVLWKVPARGDRVLALQPAWLFHRAVGPTLLWLPQVAAYGIGSVASFWVIKRVVIMVFGWDV